MAEIDLEAEQVVGEEEESAPNKKRGRAPKGVIIFGIVVVVEALVLFLIFDAIRGDDAPQADALSENTVSPFERYSKPGRVDIGDVSIYDDSEADPKADRRFTLTVQLWIEQETFAEIGRAAEINQNAMELVKDDLRREVREFMLKQGGPSLKSLENQQKLPGRIKDYINDELGPLRGKIQNVEIGNFRASRY